MQPIERTGPIVTVKDLKERHLGGVNLTFDDGSPYPDSLFEYNIRSAISILETELDMFILPTTKIDKVDFRGPDYMSWNFVQLDSYPIIDVEYWHVIFPSDNTLVDYPKSWIKVDADKGILQMFPDVGSIPYWMVGTGAYIPQLMLSKQHLPHFFEIKYRAGFDYEKVPEIINECIGIMAAMLPLDIAGEMLAGAGIAAFSLGLDGISQSISTTASPMNHGYSAKIASFKPRLKAHIEALRNYYKGIVFATC